MNIHHMYVRMIMFFDFQEIRENYSGWKGNGETNVLSFLSNVDPVVDDFVELLQSFTIYKFPANCRTSLFPSCQRRHFS